MAAAEGVTGLYKGLSAGLFRQVTYTTARLGTFGLIKDFLTKNDGAPLPFYQKAFAGMSAGAVGAVVGNPAEVALIRMTADGRLPLAERRGYKSVFDALGRVTREEGLVTLWRGTLPTVGRAMVLNVAQLATYEQAKEAIMRTGLGDNMLTYSLASAVSAIAATTASIPLDSAKTRVQNMRVINGVPEYSGMLDALRQTAAKDGFSSLWRGFTPYFLRLGPHTLLTFLCLEKLKATYYKLQGY